MRPAAPTTIFGPLTPGDPYFDPFWARVNEAGITVVVHAGDSGYSLNGYAKEGFSAEFSGGGRPSIGMMSIERAIYDFLASLIFDQLFDRFPNLRVASVENGAEFLPDLFRKFKSINRKIPGLFKEDPVETFRRHIWINPFWEDDPYEIVDLMGADRVVFGSDWPHIEGLPEPARLRVGDQGARPSVAAVDHARQRGSAQPAPAGLNPSNIRRIADDPCAPATGVARRIEDLGHTGGDALDGGVAVDEAVRDLEARPSRSDRRRRRSTPP